MSRCRVGCVQFLNARPLIDGLIHHDELAVRFDVPSRLLDDLETGAVDLALCPVIDYQRSIQPLDIVPVGGICCHGPTLTVRLFSRVPMDRLTDVFADTDSHTSVALARIILAQRFANRPRVMKFDPGQLGQTHQRLPDTLLLIGDKVVTQTPPSDDFPHQLDLGEAWHEWTAQPFVFAVWMARRGVSIDDAAELLMRQRQLNNTRIHEIVQRHAAPLGWPQSLAQQYLGDMLHYHVGPDELAAMQRFWQEANALGLIDELRPVSLAGPMRHELNKR